MAPPDHAADTKAHHHARPRGQCKYRLSAGVESPASSHFGLRSFPLDSLLLPPNVVGVSLRSLVLSAFSRRPVKLKPSDWTFVKFYFAQHGEDAVFMALWDWRKRKTGYYVDVGAYHPIDLSNTHALYRHGWRGLTIEPNPKLAPLFARHRPLGTHLTCAIGATPGEAAYYAFQRRGHGTLNTMDGALAERLRPEYGEYEKMSVPVRPLGAILAENVPADTEIDLLSVDCEGMDEIVLRSNDWNRFRPGFIMVEDAVGPLDSPTSVLLKGQGYDLVALVSITKIYRRRD